MQFKKDYVTVKEADFERNFGKDMEFQNLNDLQQHLDNLVNEYNNLLSEKGLHSQTQIANDRIELLLSQLFKE